MGAPKVIGGTPAQTGTSGNTHPAKVTLIGKSEAHLAFMRILRDNKDAKAMGVTDERAFQWSRYAHNQ